MYSPTVVYCLRREIGPCATWRKYTYYIDSHITRVLSIIRTRVWRQRQRVKTYVLASRYCIIIILTVFSYHVVRRMMTIRAFAANETYNTESVEQISLRIIIIIRHTTYYINCKLFLNSDVLSIKNTFP